jgi:hypothetical protein
MPKGPYDSGEAIKWTNTALDRMVAAGWVEKFVWTKEHGFAVKWTAEGETCIQVVFDLMKELGIGPGDQNVWLATLILAKEKFDPGYLDR